MKKNTIKNLLLLLFVIYSGCKEDPPVVPPIVPPVLKDSISVTITGTAHRSIEVKITTTSKNLNSVIEVYRQQSTADTLIAEYPITITDTTITDDNNGNDLHIDTEYSYYALRKDSTGERKDTSNIAETKTLAATSLNYTWQEFSLGSGDNPNVLYGVWGTDENNVYAVGGVTINDTVYGILHWNGNQWNPVKKNGGFQAIIGFSATDIWAVGSGVWHFNGSVWEEYTHRDPIIQDNRGFTSVWGTSSNDLYFGSSGGTIVHWNGSKAQVVYTNPSIVQVKDMDGYASDLIIGVGTGMIPPLLAVKYNGISWNPLPISSNWSLNSVSIVNRNHIYFGGDGIFEMKRNNFNRTYNSGFYMHDIKYEKQTGVTVASSAYDGVYVNNGLEWRSYKGQISNDETTYHSIFIINNTIFCVGRNDTEAKIIIGKN
ncbi:MAG: hypothetical protein M5U17_04260 [Ignavibacterium sp.]|nr:hypothetical protein [Ignavibacterium sp.]